MRNMVTWATPFIFKLLSRFYPPFLGAGIRVTKIARGYREMETRMKLHWYNKNLVGTHFGGNVYSMTDPFYMMMLLWNIGDQHLVWDKSGTIEHISPAKGEVRASFKLSQEEIDRIVEEAKDGKPRFVDFRVDIVDADDVVVAKVKKTLYVRKKPRER
jgi:acyl-coenzyme A thioesterase PaaI-like protein